MKRRKKILSILSVCVLVLSFGMFAFAGESITPYAIVTDSRIAISTTQNGSMMLNCDTGSATTVPDGAKVIILGDTGHDTQRWRKTTSPYGSPVLRPWGRYNKTKVLNCLRGGQYDCNIREESVNAETPKDMIINFTYNDKNKPSFRMWVGTRDNYGAAYVTRAGSTNASKCYWSSNGPGSTWYYRVDN